MSIRNLSALFHPASVAVIGASNRPNSVGETVLRNLVASRFQGDIYPVNPKYATLAGLRAYARVGDLPSPPDLAVLCTPPATIPGLIEALGAAGTKAAIVLTAGLGAQADGPGASLGAAMLAHARPHLLRILGPNCVGLIAPGIGLNASFAHIGALPGKLAFVSQSGALVTAVLDWAGAHGIGFSAFASLGDSADIDAGDLLDYLGADPGTDAILLYIEQVRHARKFMSAARAASRSKPVVVVKSARSAQAAQAAASHTGALAGSDAVYDAALRRAGMLRVDTTDGLFRAVETLGHRRGSVGEKLIVVTNGGGPGIMAVDALAAAGGELDSLAPACIAALDRVLPATWSRANPVDLIGDAPVERYARAFDILLEHHPGASFLFIHAPTAIVPSLDIAHALLPLLAARRQCVLSCWLGADAVAAARQSFAGAGLPCYDTPEDAVAAFLQLAQFQRNQRLLLRVPSSLPDLPPPQTALVRGLFAHAAARGETMLGEAEAKAVLRAYGIPVVETAVAATAEEVAACAQAIGFPVAVKIRSPDLSHKSDVGGVALDLQDGPAAAAAARAMQARIAALRPDAELQGFSVQAMVRRPHAHELIAGIATDRVFGPVLLFGQGGTAVEAIADRSIGLPPLDMELARDMVERTRVSRLLKGYRDRPAADGDAICRCLLGLAQLAADFPAVAELDINPLLADSGGVLALDARLRLDFHAAPDRMAIRPSPAGLERIIDWDGAPLTVRPVRPGDAEAYQAFFAALHPDDVRSRMFAAMHGLSPMQLARFTQIDYDREMALAALDGAGRMAGVARAIADPDNAEAEFAVTIRSDLKHKGLGRLLMEALIDYCRARGTQRLAGVCLDYNAAMRRLAESLGFAVAPADDDGLVRMVLQLAPGSAGPPAAMHRHDNTTRRRAIP